MMKRINRRKWQITGWLFVLFILSNACSLGSLFGPTPTPTTAPSPTPTLTPTPPPDLPQGNTFTGSTWEITLLNSQELETVKLPGGFSAQPKASKLWIVVIMQMKNVSNEEQYKSFTEGLTDAISTQQDIISFSGFILPELISGQTGSGFIGGTYTGAMNFTDDDGNTMLIVGDQDGYFSVGYNVKPGNTITVGLLYSLDAGQELMGVDIGISSAIPLFLVD